MKLSLSRLIALLLAVVGLAAVSAPAVAAQDDGGDASGPQTIVVHRVDARAATTEVVAITDDYSVGAGEVSVVENDSDVQVGDVSTAVAKGRSQEVIFVMDTSQRLATGDVFETVKAEMAEAIRSMAPGTMVGVVAAGDTATVRSSLTTNLSAAAREVEELSLSGDAALFNAMDRAGAELSADSDAFQTIVVFSGGEDTQSAISASAVRTRILQLGAQVVAVRYQGGEVQLSEIVNSAGGVAIGASTAPEAAQAIADAASIAGNRLIVTYPGQTESNVRGDVTLTAAGTSTSFSYAGGTLTERAIALTPAVTAEASGIAFFRTTNGLYLALALTFAGMALAVWSLGSLFASGETSLEGLLSRYSGDGDGAALDEEESAIVQTALVKRAVEMSESFAEDRGFLAKIEELLERARLPLRAGEAMSIFALGILVAAVLGFFIIGGFIGSLILAALTAGGLLFTVQFLAKRRIRKFEQQLPDTLQLLAGTLRAGYSLPQGLEAVSHEIADPMGYELRRVMTEARLGREIEDSLAATAERLNSPDFAWAVMAIGIQREVGGNLNELLMTVSDTMIARERLKGEVAALTAEGKMSAILLGGLPPGLGFVMWLMNPKYINQLFVTTLGNVLLGLGIVSALIGFAWMKKVITINV